MNYIISEKGKLWETIRRKAKGLNHNYFCGWQPVATGKIIKDYFLVYGSNLTSVFFLFPFSQRKVGSK